MRSGQYPDFHLPPPSSLMTTASSTQRPMIRGPSSCTPLPMCQIAPHTLGHMMRLKAKPTGET